MGSSHISATSFATGATYLKQPLTAAWALACLAFTFWFSIDLNMEVIMKVHAEMLGVAAVLWSLVGKLHPTQR
jgi:hypothetical protein